MGTLMTHYKKICRHGVHPHLEKPTPGLAFSAWLQFYISNLSSGNSRVFQTASDVRAEGVEAVNCPLCGLCVAQMRQCLLRSQEPLSF